MKNVFAFSMPSQFKIDSTKNVKTLVTLKKEIILQLLTRRIYYSCINLIKYINLSILSAWYRWHMEYKKKQIIRYTILIMNIYMHMKYQEQLRKKLEQEGTINGILSQLDGMITSMGGFLNNQVRNYQHSTQHLMMKPLIMPCTHFCCTRLNM